MRISFHVLAAGAAFDGDDVTKHPFAISAG
jgi:hypothetical protein